MWIDTHIHLDAAEYGGQQEQLLSKARIQGVGAWVIPAVNPSNFDAVQRIAHQTQGASYALGIHPMCASACQYEALDILQAALETHQHDPKLVAVGEIGLDYFVPPQSAQLGSQLSAQPSAQLSTQALEKQQHFFVAQLKLASRYGLPVLLHVRRSVDHIAKYLRLHPVPGGIAHAFNGSAQQAQSLIDLGFCLGFGGAVTYTRALQIRERLATVPSTAIVLETDGPDLAPAWLAKQVNPPSALAQIGAELAAIRGIPIQEFAALCANNSRRVLPKLAY